MKKFILLTMAAAALGVVGCSDDAMPGVSNERNAGTVIFRSEVDGDMATRANVNIATFGAYVPASDEFKLVLSGGDFETPREWATLGAYNADVKNGLCSFTSSQDVESGNGLYTAVVTYGDPEAEGENKPYYYGNKTNFELKRGTNTPIYIDAYVANSVARIVTTESFDKFFSGAEFTLKTQSGYTTTFKPADGEMTPVFVKAGTTEEVSGKPFMQKQTDDDSSAVECALTTSPITSAAKTIHTFRFDATNAGEATLTVNLSENETITANVEVELNDWSKK